MPGRGARVARGRNPPPKTHEYLNDTAKCTYHLYLSSLALFLNLTSLYPSGLMDFLCVFALPHYLLRPFVLIFSQVYLLSSGSHFPLIFQFALTSLPSLC